MKIQDWIGYLEHANPEKLGVFEANPGKGGWTIFAEIIRQRGGPYLQQLPWCVTFIHAMIDREDLIGRAHPGCRVLQRRMKRQGYWRNRDYIPVPGDLIFCSNTRTRRVDHCGIVEEVRGKQIISIDGNTVDPSGVFAPQDGGAVARRIRDADDPIIVGYGAIGTLYD